MSAPLKNQFWKMRARSGPKPTYDVCDQGAEKLWTDCCAYFEDRSQRTMNKTPLPFTQASLCVFLGITQKTWIDWRVNREDLREVIARVDDIIFDQKFCGAAVGSYNANLISRDLRLEDKQDTPAPMRIERIILTPSDVAPSEQLRDFLDRRSEQSIQSF